MPQKAARCLALLALLLLSLGCASRSLPESHPPDSPVSPDGPEPERASVTRALDEDPPLPGEPSAGWAGLEPPAEAATVPDEAAASAAYVCPMHPEVTSDHPGRCPKCGMNLEPRK